MAQYADTCAPLLLQSTPCLLAYGFWDVVAIGLCRVLYQGVWRFTAVPLSFPNPLPTTHSPSHSGHFSRNAVQCKASGQICALLHVIRGRGGCPHSLSHVCMPMLVAYDQLTCCCQEGYCFVSVAALCRTVHSWERASQAAICDATFRHWCMW